VLWRSISTDSGCFCVSAVTASFCSGVVGVARSTVGPDFSGQRTALSKHPAAPGHLMQESLACCTHAVLSATPTTPHATHQAHGRRLKLKLPYVSEPSTQPQAHCTCAGVAWLLQLRSVLLTAHALFLNSHTRCDWAESWPSWATRTLVGNLPQF
jgi:hypothetical protein